MTTTQTEGEILKTLIEEVGISIKGLGRRINVDRGTIHKWIKNENKKGIGLDNWLNIGKALNVDVFEYLPNLKRHKPKTEGNESKDTLLKVSELEANYKSQKRDVDFLKARIDDSNELIEAKNQLIEVKDQQLKDARSRIAELEEKLKNLGS